MGENTQSPIIVAKHIKTEFVEIKKEKPDEIFVSDIKTELLIPPLCPIKVEPEPDYDANLQIKTEKCEEPETLPKNKNVFYSCNECEFITKFKWCFDDHLSTNHKVEEPVVEKAPEYIHCDLCSFKSQREYNLARHIKYKHETSLRLYNCEYCDHVTNNKSNLRRHVYSLHLKIDRATTEHECTHCGYKTKSKSNLKRHTSSKHLNTKRSNEYKCTDCEYTSRDKSNLRKHMLSKHEMKTSKCGFCDFTTQSPTYLKVHMKKHVKNQIKCPHCSVSVSHNRYWLHIRTYHSSDLKWYNCNKCSFRSTDREELIKHTPCEEKEIKFEEIMIKSEEKDVEVSSTSGRFKCDECSYTTNKKYNLGKHQLYRHTDVDEINWLCCPHCTYKAKTKERYKRHLRTHSTASGEKLFRCGECSYVVRTKSALERHKEVEHANVDTTSVQS